MAVRIGHASIDENGRATGGAEGDQTGREICIRNWYAKDWKVLLRAKDPAVRRKIAASCIAACNNENLGYDQSGRNTGLQEAKKVGWDFAKITKKAEFDCSSLASACVQAAGVTVWEVGTNAPTTRTLEKVLTATGAFEALRDEKYLTGTDYLLEGDLLLKPGSHVVIVLGNDEEIPVQPVHTKKPEQIRVYYSVRLPLLTKGMEGEDVRTMQQLLISKDYELPRDGADGEYGDETENALLLFQEDNGLQPDAKCGQATWSALLGVKGVG